MSLPRRLTALFIGVMALMAGAFGWLSWRVIEQDRANLSRLVVLKNRYDSTNVFQRNSNVEPG